MEEVFNKLMKDGKNNLENIVKWMQDSKIVEKTKASEEKARQMFADVADKSNVEFTKFQEALAKLAEEQKKSAENLFTKLSGEGSKLCDAAASAAQAGARAASTTFHDRMKK